MHVLRSSDSMEQISAVCSGHLPGTPPHGTLHCGLCVLSPKERTTLILLLHQAWRTLKPREAACQGEAARRSCFSQEPQVTQLLNHAYLHTRTHTECVSYTRTYAQSYVHTHSHILNHIPTYTHTHAHKTSQKHLINHQWLLLLEIGLGSERNLTFILYILCHVSSF